MPCGIVLHVISCHELYFVDEISSSCVITIFLSLYISNLHVVNIVQYGIFWCSNSVYWLWFQSVFHFHLWLLFKCQCTFSIYGPFVKKWSLRFVKDRILLVKCNLTLAMSPSCNSICPLSLPSHLLTAILSEIWIIIQSDFWSSPHRRTDRKWRIWAHRAKYTGGLKYQIKCTGKNRKTKTHTHTHKTLMSLV